MMGGMWPVDLLQSNSKQPKVNKSTTPMPSAGQCSELFATRSRVPPPCSHTMTAFLLTVNEHSVLQDEQPMTLSDNLSSSTLIQCCHWPELHQKTNCLRNSFFQPDKSTRILMMSVTNSLQTSVSDWIFIWNYFNVNDTASQGQWQCIWGPNSSVMSRLVPHTFWKLCIVCIVCVCILCIACLCLRHPPSFGSTNELGPPGMKENAGHKIKSKWHHNDSFELNVQSFVSEIYCCHLLQVSEVPTHQLCCYQDNISVRCSQCQLHDYISKSHNHNCCQTLALETLSSCLRSQPGKSKAATCSVILPIQGSKVTCSSTLNSSSC